MNKIIDKKQCTILWHVDDLKTSHFEPAVVSSVHTEIDAEYAKISKMTITRGKLHKYLRMTIDYSYPGKVIFSYAVCNFLICSRQSSGQIKECSNQRMGVSEE